MAMKKKSERIAPINMSPEEFKEVGYNIIDRIEYTNS